ncbi:Fructokinase [bacterium HR27]|nr:Fructokinase [bacterium HR27]
MLRGLEHAEIVKLSREELAFLTGSSDPAAARQLWHERLQLLVVTLGAAGCAYLTPQEEGEVPGFTVPVVDTTGAGDGFVAGLLVGLLEQGLDWSKRAVEQALRLANAVGALVCTRRGAIPALPTRRQVQRLLTMSGDVSRHE